MDTDLTIYERVIAKFHRRYGQLELKTNNDKLNTKIASNISEANIIKSEYDCMFSFDKVEIPILCCKLSNENVIVLTTQNMYSRFENNIYKMNYHDFQTSDRSYYRSSRQLGEGKTRIFKYTHSKGEFIYEIDSFYPADAAHNVVLHGIWIGYFDEV